MAVSGKVGFFIFAVLAIASASTQAASLPGRRSASQPTFTKSDLYESLHFSLLVLARTVHTTMISFAEKRFQDNAFDPHVKESAAFTPLKDLSSTNQPSQKLQQTFLEKEVKQLEDFKQAFRQIEAHEQQVPQGDFSAEFKLIGREIDLAIDDIKFAQRRLGYSITASPTSPQSPAKPAQTSQDEWELNLMKVLLNCLHPMLYQSHIHIKH